MRAWLWARQLVGYAGVQGLRRDEEVDGYDFCALVQKLEERMLTIRAGLSENHRRSLDQMGVAILSAQKEFLEMFLAYSDRKQESDRRPDRNSVRQPNPKIRIRGHF
jgi:hypothetical protein